jgi:hypothetical protein
MTQASIPAMGVCSAPPLSSESQWTIRPSWMRSGGRGGSQKVIAEEKTVISNQLSVISVNKQ